MLVLWFRCWKTQLWDGRERCWEAGKEGVVPNYRIKLETKTKNIQSLHKAAHSYTEGNCAQQIVLKFSPPQKECFLVWETNKGEWRGIGWLYRTWNNNWIFQKPGFRVVLREGALRILQWQNACIFGLPSIFILTFCCISSFKSSGLVDYFMTQVVLSVIRHSPFWRVRWHFSKVTVGNRRKYPFRTVTF